MIGKIYDLEYIHLISPLESDIIVYSEDEHEGKEDSSSSKKMPDIVTIKEI